MLYLLKSAINNEYFQENLRILAAPVGEEMTVDYVTRWVDPALWGNIGRGEDACLVFSDRPYHRFVPVRRALVVKVVDEAGVLTITVRLGPLARCGDLRAFSQHFSQLSRRQYFVVRASESPLDFVPEGEDGLEDWKQIIRALQVSPGEGRPSRYARSIFLRYLPPTEADEQSLLLSIEGQAGQTRRRPCGVLASTAAQMSNVEMRAGQTYYQPIYCYAPGLEPDRLSDYSLVVEPGTHNVEIGKIPPLQLDGLLVLEITPLEAGEDLILDVWIRPDRARSAALHLRYPVAEAPPGEEVEAVPRVAPAGLDERYLRAIFQVIHTDDGPARDQALLELIDRDLHPLLPDSPFLKEQRALCLYRLERWLQAYEAFSALDPDRVSPEAIVAWFVSACRAGIETDLGAILKHFNAWERTALTDQLIDALPMVEEERRLQLLRDTWLGAGRYREMWQAVRDTFTRPAAILEVVDLMVDETLYNVLTPAQGYRYLRERMEVLGQAPLELLRRAVELGLQQPDEAPGLEELFLELIDRLLQRSDDPTEALAMIDQARGRLSDHAWVEVTERLADALAKREEGQWRSHACKLYVDLARVCREQFQDLDAAEAYLIQAHCIVGEDQELAEAVDAEEARWTAAVEQIEAVRLWRDGLAEVRRERMREVLSGKRAIFVGGVKRGFDVEAVRTELGLAEAEFVSHFHSERGRLNKVRQRIRQGQVDYVIDFVRFGAHRNLEEDCKRAGVTYVRVPRGRSLDRIIGALAEVHGIRLK
ncbi:MAG TPA: hypothetical protein EYH32_08475 [Anaerolineae bacterium]|nr:hypothetical protein [Anaerolineae bacterium]